MQSKIKPGFRIAVFAAVFAVVVVMLGAFTRLVDAGLGCPDWPVCYGHILWPMEEHEVAAANERFPETPVEHDKTWPEQVHRIFASSLGLFCIVLAAIALRERYANRNMSYPLFLPCFLLALVILQGLFGMWTVTLNLWPQVVTAHLLGGFATLALLCLLALNLSGFRWRVDDSAALAALRQQVKPLAAFALVVVIAQIALGGWTTSNYAALACPDLPLCQKSWWPAMDFAQGFNIFQSIGPNYLGGLMDSASRTAIHMMHRVGAIITALVVIVLVIRLRRAAFETARRYANLLAAILFVQLLLGISNVIFALPLAVAVLHNAVGALLLITTAALNYFICTANSDTLDEG